MTWCYFFWLTAIKISSTSLHLHMFNVLLNLFAWNVKMSNPDKISQHTIHAVLSCLSSVLYANVFLQCCMRMCFFSVVCECVTSVLYANVLLQCCMRMCYFSVVCERVTSVLYANVLLKWVAYRTRWKCCKLWQHIVILELSLIVMSVYPIELHAKWNKTI